MDIKELKERINKNTLTGDFMIWVMEDDTSQIIIDQYLKKICDNKRLKLKTIDDLSGIPDTSFAIDDNLYILRVDKYEGESTPENCIVLCKKCKNKEAIKIPKLEDWQVIDFLSSRVPGLDRREIEWLATQYNRNYGRMINDLDKISIFSKEAQNGIYKMLLDDGQFKDITSLDIWDLTNGIIRRDKDLVCNVLKVIDYIDVEPVGLITTLYRGFKNVIRVQLGNSVSAEDLGLSGKQFFVIKKYNCGHYSREELVKIFDLLTDMEYKYKYEGVEMKQLIDFMIVNIMGV